MRATTPICIQSLRPVLKVFAVLLTMDALGQSGEGQRKVGLEDYQLHVAASETEIKVDGALTEDAWSDAEVVSDFWITKPRDGVHATRRTEARLTYDEQNLYIGVVCYDSGRAVVQTLKRDIRYFDGDGFAVVLDPVNNRTNGFFFGVSPLNVQSEDLLSANGMEPDFSWDNRWASQVKIYDDRWVVEMAIPFKTLRFKTGNDTWGINFIRNDLKLNEYDTWTPVPVNFDGFDLGYTGSLVWDQPPPSAGANVSFIPYITGSVTRDTEEDPVSTTGAFDAGFDAKVAVTPSMNLDLTVNPDFSQIEVDEQQTNLTRFSLNYPERRKFFLENADIFSQFAGGPFRPFFSRRIGLDDEAQPIPILFGARLSGNATNKLRIGLMSMHTRPKDGSPAENYSAMALHQRVLERSLIKFYATNRQGFLKGSGADSNDFGRNAGLELNYVSRTGSVEVIGAYHLSQEAGQGTAGVPNLRGGYFGRNFSIFGDFFHLPNNYYADMGFIPRLENYDAERDTVIHMGFVHLFSRSEYVIRPKAGGKVNEHSFQLSNAFELNPDYTMNERMTDLQYDMRFANTAQLSATLSDNDVILQFPTSFIRGTLLPVGRYGFTQGRIRYESDQRKALAFTAGVQAGSFYNGTLRQYEAGIIYREQPWGNFSIKLEQNDIKLAEGYGEASITLLSERTEISFSNSLFWITFLQYNTQRNNFNVNSRFQWRFLPMSDLYIVYTDNYFTNPMLQERNRALVFKLNYWLTL